MTMTKFFTAALATVTFPAEATIAADYGWFEESPHAESMQWTEAQKAVYRNADPEILGIYRVFNRADDPTLEEGGNDCFRWSALGAGSGRNTVFATCQRVTSHSGRHEDHPMPHSQKGFKRSTDGGHTWEPYVDIATEAKRFPHGGRAATSALPLGVEGAAFGRHGSEIFMVNGDHIRRFDGTNFWRSTDDGLTWKNLSHDHGALTRQDLGWTGPIGSANSIENGVWIDLSVIIKHPVAGYMIFGRNRYQNELDYGHRFEDRNIHLLTSLDGVDWTYHKIKTGWPAKETKKFLWYPVLYDKDKIMLYGGYGTIRTARFIVHGPSEFSVKDFGIVAASHSSVSDCILNPVTDRFEAVYMNRKSGREFHGADHDHGVFLISISMADFEAGSHTWKDEARLFTMPGDFLWRGCDKTHDEASDGGNTAGGIIHDGKHKLTLEMATTACDYGCVYMLERTLDTPALVAYLKSQDRALKP